MEHQRQLTQSVDNRDRPIVRIEIPTENGWTLIDVQDIVYCKSDGGYTKFLGVRTKGRENLLSMASDSLIKFEKALSTSNFCRIHDFHIINMAHLKSYVNGRGGQVQLTDGTGLNGTELNVSEGGKWRLNNELSRVCFKKDYTIKTSDRENNDPTGR